MNTASTEDLHSSTSKPLETRKNHNELLLQEVALIFLVYSEHICTPNFTLVAYPSANSESSLYRSDGDFSRTDVPSSQYNHLNNASAVEMLNNARWEALSRYRLTPIGARLAIRRYDIDYGDSSRFGDHLEIHSWFEPLPEEGREFTWFQRITRAGKTMIQAHSRWFWRAA